MVCLLPLQSYLKGPHHNGLPDSCLKSVPLFIPQGFWCIIIFIALLHLPQSLITSLIRFLVFLLHWNRSFRKEKDSSLPHICIPRFCNPAQHSRDTKLVSHTCIHLITINNFENKIWGKHINTFWVSCSWLLRSCNVCYPYKIKFF